MQPQHLGSPWSGTYGKAHDGASSKSSRGLAHGAFADTTKTHRMTIQRSSINCQADGRPSKYPNLTVQARKYPAKTQIRTSPLDRRCRPVICHSGREPHPFQHTIPNTCHHPTLSIHYFKEVFTPVRDKASPTCDESIPTYPALIRWPAHTHQCQGRRTRLLCRHLSPCQGP